MPVGQHWRPSESPREARYCKLWIPKTEPHLFSGSSCSPLVVTVYPAQSGKWRLHRPGSDACPSAQEDGAEL